MTDSAHTSPLPHTDNPASLAKPGGHYSHVAVANGFVFVSGQLPINAQGEKLADASFDAQAEQVLANVKAALESVGSSVAPSMLGKRIGSATMRQYSNRDAPRFSAASRHSVRRPSSAGVNTRTISGIWK